MLSLERRRSGGYGRPAADGEYFKLFNSQSGNPTVAGFGAGPFALFQTAWHHRSLILRLARREIDARYRGSVLGIVWAVLNPILMLAVYTFVFSVVFQARWGATGEATRNSPCCCSPA